VGEPAWDDMVTVGRIARTHGIRGQVIVNPETDFPGARFQPGARMYRLRDGVPQAIAITVVRFHQGRPIIGIEGVDSMTAAEALAGQELRVPSDSLQALPESTFYRHDLVGCVVRTVDGREVGIVARVEGPFAGGWLAVESASGEVLIPLAAEICVRITPAAREIVVDPPEGLLGLNA
jgi:16S rRNA processing protein RimM